MAHVMSDFKDQPLPSFKNPPVIETVLGVQFDPLTELQSCHLGALWERKFRKEFPRTEDRGPLDAVVETYGAPQTAVPRLRLQMVERPPVPRCWFVKADGSQLVQVQPDRFIHNWRKVGVHHDYPRYDKIRSQFSMEMERFQEFLTNEGIGNIHANQWEVTYVNHIPANGIFSVHGEIEKLITIFSMDYSDNFLGTSEATQFSGRYLIRSDDGEFIGRLHITAQPVFSAENDNPLIILTLTARGKPIEESFEGILLSLDLGRQYVVRGFASITTEEAHVVWERDDVC